MTRIQGPDPVTNAIAFARYTNGKFGWGVVDPGHGLVFENAKRPLDAAAAVGPVGHAAPYGPLLLVSEPRRARPSSTERYLLDIQPGYEKDPVRGVYNHGWFDRRRERDLDGRAGADRRPPGDRPVDSSSSAPDEPADATELRQDHE